MRSRPSSGHCRSTTALRTPMTRAACCASWARPEMSLGLVEGDDQVRAHPQTIVGGNFPPAIVAPPLLRLRGRRGGALRRTAPALTRPTVEDYGDVAIVLKSLEEIVVQPRVMPGHDKQVPSHLGGL